VLLATTFHLPMSNCSRVIVSTNKQTHPQTDAVENIHPHPSVNK